MAHAKVNGGSSYPNQGEPRSKQGAAGQNQSYGGKSKPPKQDAKVWKAKGKKNPPVPKWLA